METPLSPPGRNKGTLCRSRQPHTGICARLCTCSGAPSRLRGPQHRGRSARSPLPPAERRRRGRLSARAQGRAVHAPSAEAGGGGEREGTAKAKHARRSTLAPSRARNEGAGGRRAPRYLRERLLRRLRSGSPALHGGLPKGRERGASASRRKGRESSRLFPSGCSGGGGRTTPRRGLPVSRQPLRPSTVTGRIA